MWARRWLLLGSPCNVQLGEAGLVRQAVPEDVRARGVDQMVKANASGEGRGIPRTLDPIVGNLDSEVTHD